MDVDIRSSDLEQLAKRLRKLEDGKVLRREMTAGLREATKPLVPQVRAAVRAVPSKSDGDLRDRIARAVQVKVTLAGFRTGVRIRVDTARLGAKAPVAALLEGRRRWRHPVFGNRDAWVTQQPHPYLRPTVEPRAGEVRRKLQRVADDIARRIEGR